MTYKEPEILNLGWPNTSLGTRARNALCISGYRTIEQVVDFYQQCHDSQDVPYMRGRFGSKCDEITREVFRQIDIELPDVDFSRWKWRLR